MIRSRLALGLALVTTLPVACGGAVQGERADAEPGRDDANAAGTTTKTPRPGSVTGSSSSGSSPTTSTGGVGSIDVTISGCGAATGGAGGDASGGAATEDPIVTRLGLITGDEACPPTSPMTASCSDETISCVYRGVETPTWSIGTARCVCLEGNWECVGSDSNGDTQCPPTEPHTDAACPPGGQQCHYAHPGRFGSGCYCADGGSWACGL